MPSTLSTAKLWPFWASEPQKLKAALANLDGFLVTRSCLASDRKTGLAIDETAKRICLMDADSTLVTRRLFSYQDLRSCEIIEDGAVIASTDHPADGAKAGARRASSTHSNASARVGLVALKLVLNEDAPDAARKAKPSIEKTSIEKPLIHIVRFLHQGASRGGSTHQAALEAAQVWYRLMMAYLSLGVMRAPAAPIALLVASK